SCACRSQLGRGSPGLGRARARGWGLGRGGWLGGVCWGAGVGGALPLSWGVLWGGGWGLSVGFGDVWGPICRGAGAAGGEAWGCSAGLRGFPPHGRPGNVLGGLAGGGLLGPLRLSGGWRARNAGYQARWRGERAASVGHPPP